MMSARPDKPPSPAANTAAAEPDSPTGASRAARQVDLLLDDLEAPPVAGAPASPGARRGGAGRAVLVVDSTPIARKFLALRLESLGYRVHVADAAEQALAMIEQRAYSIVFLELVFAAKDGIDGLGLCQAIKHKPDHPGGVVPAVVVVTGHTGSSDRVRAALAGCDAYLTKPLVKEDLITAMGEVDRLFN